MRATWFLIAAVALSRLSSAATPSAPGTRPDPAGVVATTQGVDSRQVGCCGQQMALLGQATVWELPGGTTSQGVAVPADLRTEVYGEELEAKATLPAGSYRVEITASENSLAQAGLRVFSVIAYSGGTPGAIKGEPAAATEIARNIDLFSLAGGQGKPYTLKASVKHSGGPLRIVFTASSDNAKFSAIRIFDDAGNKVAWLFAEDLADLLKLPDTPPVVAGPMIWKDPAQPVEKRVADLVRRMTLKEKVRQITYNAPAIERLGLPAYNYWSECLHGVARNGIATVFPQAIGMSATFDPASMRQVGDVISTEARAKFNGWQEQGGTDYFYGGLYKGLTFWSPNINLFRDPRWGRGQETYGEDPYLTGMMAVSFIRGLQGDDSKYLKVVATAKHYAVHSGPESQRHTFNAAPPIRDLYESYLPQFEMAVREGKVYSVMGAYNRVYGSPANASDLLLRNVLRRDWGFTGYVVSDCGAINDIWANHQVEQDRASAAAAAVLAGCDLECGAGGADYPSLPLAVDRNLIGEGAIDQALARVLTSRFRLGLFDPPEQVAYARISAKENDTPAHGALALRMAHESIVLLKNDGTLPLKKSAAKIAVVGPNGDTLLPLLGNYNGTPSAPVTVLQGLRNSFKGSVVQVRGCDNVPRDFPWQLVPDVCLHPAGSADPLETGLRAEHFAGGDLTGAPAITRTEKAVDLHGLLEWTLPGMPGTPSSSRWSGEFIAPADGEYQLLATGATAYRFTVAGKVVTDLWGAAAEEDPATAIAPASQPEDLSQPRAMVLQLKAGQRVPVTLECHQESGYVDLQLWWNRIDLDLSAQVAQRVRDADVIVFAGGLDGRTEAEEGDIRGHFKGFTNGDRDAIEMPVPQTALLKALVATGKPVVLVNLTGSATAMPWEAEHVQAIVQAWYPGQAGGTAIADVLFGDYNPSGRLPVTFYRATTDLPAFDNYAMKGRTYRYFTGQPLWSFGTGLSYTTFRYSSMTVSKTQASAVETITVGIDLTNAGKVAGEEVVQVYARPAQGAAGDPQQRLVAFTRVSMAPGTGKHVEIPVSLALLRTWDPEKKAYIVPAGRWSLAVAASSTDTRASRDITIGG